jgi:hypothetical protein
MDVCYGFRVTLTCVFIFLWLIQQHSDISDHAIDGEKELKRIWNEMDNSISI